MEYSLDCGGLEQKPQYVPCVPVTKHSTWDMVIPLFPSTSRSCFSCCHWSYNCSSCCHYCQCYYVLYWQQEKWENKPRNILSTTINYFISLDVHQEPYSFKLLWLHNICKVVTEHWKLILKMELSSTTINLLCNSKQITSWVYKEWKWPTVTSWVIITYGNTGL